MAWFEGQLAFSRDGTRVGASVGTGRVFCYDLATGKEQSLRTDDKAFYSFVGFTPADHLLAFEITRTNPVESRAQLGIADLSTGKRVASLGAEEAGAWPVVALRPDGQVLAVGDTFSATLWDLRIGSRLGKLDLEGDGSRPLRALCFSHDGRLLAAGTGGGYGGGGTVGVWDVKTRKRLHAFTSEDCEINALALSPDGKLLAGSGMHGSGVRLWDLSTGKERAYLTHACAGQFFAIGFAPDGKTLAANWHDMASDWAAGVALWDVGTGRLLGVLKGAQRELVRLVAFSPDGHKLAAVDDRGTLQVWQTVRPSSPGK